MPPTPSVLLAGDQSLAHGRGVFEASVCVCQEFWFLPFDLMGILSTDD